MDLHNGLRGLGRFFRFLLLRLRLKIRGFRDCCATGMPLVKLEARKNEDIEL